MLGGSFLFWHLSIFYYNINQFMGLFMERHVQLYHINTHCPLK